MKLLSKTLVMLVLTVILGGSFLSGYDLGSKAGMVEKNGEVITEEVLLQKDNVINDIVIYEEGLNPFFATSKSALIANLRLDKIEGLREKGFVIEITSEGDESISQPVQVENNVIRVSIYSSDSEFLDVLNNI